MFQKTHHHHHRKPVEITAPGPGIGGHFQYPPPAHLLLQQHEHTDHNNQSKRASGRRYTASSSQENPYRGRSQSLSSSVHPANGSSSSKEDKKKKFSLFKKKKKSDNDRRTSRTPEVPGRKGKSEQYSGYGPESMPLTRRPHSSSSNHRGGGGGGGGTEEFIRKGSQRSIKSSDFLDDDDEIDSSVNNGGGGGKVIPRPMLQTDYPRFMSTLVNGRDKGDNGRLDNGRPGYDSLEKYADIGRAKEEGPSNEPFKNRSMSLRLPDHKNEQRIVPSRPAPPPPGNKPNRAEQPPVETVGVASNGVTPPPLPPIPGLIGIKNHGNTCFMNAILQCLGNTERFLHYIISDDCQRDLATLKRKKKRRGPASPHNTLTTGASSQQEEYLSPDSPGAVIDVLSYLIKSLWGGQYEGRISAIFKEVVGLWAEQYRGRSQHDAQEFLLWLLGYLHDNLNLASRHQISKVK